MKENTKKTSTVIEEVQSTLAGQYVNQDLKHSVLIISLIANLIVFTTWVALQVTTQYDAQIASLLFAR